MAKNKPVLEAKSVQRKEYSYNMGEVKLSFTLRTDVKIELVAFKELLERALEDVNTDLEAFN